MTVRRFVTFGRCLGAVPRRCVARVPGRRRPADRRAGPRRRQRVQRLPLPPDQLRAGGHRRPRSFLRDHGRQGRPRRRCSASRCSSSGRTATPATSRRPTTCRPTRRSTTTRSPTRHRHGLPLAAARRAGALRPDDHRLQPGRHVRAPTTSGACCKTFPGVFTGIGEFTIHKEFVSSKVAGETASLINPALDRILDFAGEVGLVVILHNDIDMPFPKAGQEPVTSTQIKALLQRHPKTTIIWAHAGLGRIVRPVEDRRRLPSAADAPRDARGDAHRRVARPRLLRHLVGRGRQVRRRRRRRRSRLAADAQPVIPIASCSAPTRSRRPDRSSTSRSTTCRRRCSRR